MNSQLVVLQDRLQTAETTIASQEEDIRKLNQSSERRGRRADSDDENDGLAPKKFFEPPIMTKSCTYREWAEELAEYLEEKSRNVVELLKEAAASKTTIESLGVTEAIVKKGQRLYRLLKRCISKECKEARLFVKDIPGKNVWEAWRPAARRRPGCGWRGTRRRRVGSWARPRSTSRAERRRRSRRRS